MKPQQILNVLVLLGLFSKAEAQNKTVSIGTLTPDNSAVLHLESNNQGFLMTRQDSSEIKLIVNPTNGLIVFNQQDECFWYKRSVGWKRICTTDSMYNKFIQTNNIKTDSIYVGGTPIKNVINNMIDTIAWLTKGNNGINSTKHFIGTINPADWVIKTSNTERMRILSGGSVGVGHINPPTLFSVGKGFKRFNVDSNGVVYLEWGSENRPQLTFISDTTTGIYYPNYSTFGVSVGGKTGLYINGFNKNIYLGVYGSYTSFGNTSSGNIGIGNAQILGNHNYGMGAIINGDNNICMESAYNFLASSITGRYCTSIGAGNHINSPSGSIAHVFGFNNNSTSSCPSCGSQFLIGSNNTYTGNSPGIIYLIGTSNTATSNSMGSIALGGFIDVNNKYNLALSDWTAPSYTTKIDNQMIARFQNGYAFYTNVAMTNGVTVAPGGGSWASTSDKNVKENVHKINYEVILNKFCSIPVTEWSYISQRVTEINKYNKQPLHIGIMAQDFNEVFGYGEFNNRITQTDIDGVFAASIIALNEKTNEIYDLKKEIMILKELVNKLAIEKTIR